MPEPLDPPPMTPHEEREWRAEFKRAGRRVVLEKHLDYRPLIKRDLAIVWLHELDKADEFVRSWSFYIAVASIVISILALIVAVIALSK
jgi:formyltetrahydrofolate synthetase